MNCHTLSYLTPVILQHQTLSSISVMTILERLRNRDSEMFQRITDAVKTDNTSLILMLASELTQIRILERNLCMILDLFKMQHN
ncbi:MAG: hypothetical protein ACE5RF_07535 [Nitrosarchaeum sp.]